MKRIDKIYNYILDKSQKFTKEKLLDIKGFHAQEIEEELDILKSNVCRELNVLCRNKKIIKIKNRPVLYFDGDCFEKILGVKLPEDLDLITNINEFVKKESKVFEEKESPFDYLIGASTSLKNQIEQAKAAILYPPSGQCRQLNKTVI